jgi:hypothetical protein
MNFPNEVWITEDDFGTWSRVSWNYSPADVSRKYIRADLVPISCGGTMGEKTVCHWTWDKEGSVFDTQCGNCGPFKERYCQYCGGVVEYESGDL